jgi:hypothetical protein
MQAVKKTLEWRFLSEDLTIFHKHFGKETRSLVPDIWWKIGIGINLASHLKIWCTKYTQSSIQEASIN